MRRAVALALVLFVTSFSTVAASQSNADENATWADQEHCEFFEQTDKYLCFGFRSYWHEYGGVEIFGYPITNEMTEDGRTVQYFQRARFEWHPGVWPARHDVLQGLLGSELAAATESAHHAAFEPTGDAGGDCVYFDATGHNVCGVFLERWNMSGGLPVFGYPISEAHEHDGMTVQFFQRQRMEHQPGAWPERHDVLLGLIGSEILALSDELPPAPEPTVEVLATDLVQPRGVNYTDHGVYVAEAGLGGDGPCIINAQGGEVCLGFTSGITVADGDGAARIVSELPSLGAPGAEAVGAHDTYIDDEGNIFVVMGLGADPAARDELGEAGGLFAALVMIDTQGELSVIADLGEFEATENPDGAVDEEGTPHPDSNPYYIARDGENFIIADAGGNSLLRVSMDGDIELVAVFDREIVPSPPFIPGDEMPMEQVPTGVAIGPDGNYYVGMLTGFPFPVGGAKVFQVSPGGDVSVYAEGFTNIGDLAFGPDGRLYVLEIIAGGLLNVDEEAAMEGDPSSLASRIVIVDHDGSQTPLMLPGLFFATGLDVSADGELYLVNMSVLPSAQLMKITLP